MWCFRFRWPARLAARGIGGELVVSLGTADYSVALSRARRLRSEVESLMTPVHAFHVEDRSGTVAEKVTPLLLCDSVQSLRGLADGRRARGECGCSCHA